MSQALLVAAHALATAGGGATLRELSAKACVGADAARHIVADMHRRGKLQIVRTRRVAYRNRPVAEYAPAPLPSPRLELGQVFQAWAG